MNFKPAYSSNPFRGLLTLFVWMGLEFLVWNAFSAEKILDKFPKRKRSIENAIHAICGILAIGLAVFVLDDLERLTGLGLLD